MAGGDIMSMEQAIKNTISYTEEVSQEEHRFRDLFGKEELLEVRSRYYFEGGRSTYLDYLREEKQRKLREQDGE